MVACPIEHFAPVGTMWAANCIHLQRLSFSRSSGDVGSVGEERKVIAATPETVALGMICSREVPLEMKRKLLELQKA